MKQPNRLFYIVIETDGVETLKRMIPYDIYLKALREAKTRFSWMRRMNRLGKGFTYEESDNLKAIKKSIGRLRRLK